MERNEFLSDFSLYLCVSLCVSVITRYYSDSDSKSCVTLRARIANQLGEDSCCRGGIVNTRGGCSRALRLRPQSPKALWRFRASTSNSPSGRSRPQPTRISVKLIILTLNKIFEYVEMTI